MSVDWIDESDPPPVPTSSTTDERSVRFPEYGPNITSGSETNQSFSNSREASASGEGMAGLKGSKFAQLLGFGSGPPDESFPVNMAALDSREISGELPDVEGGSVNSMNVNPIRFYQVGRRVVDGQWAMNYQEAAIYLEEGENNDIFTAHPKRRESLPAYLLAHQKWFYILDWLASVTLLLLAVFEKPAILQVPIGVHASLELGALTIITFGFILKTRWLGWKITLSHQRTLIKTTALVFMFAEAVIVLVRQQSHFRVTRALRPIFLVDNRYLRGVRRFSRQVLY